MKNTPVNPQILYELAMSMGNSFDMHVMLQESLGTYLQKLNCDGAAVLKSHRDKDGHPWNIIHTIPPSSGNDKVFQHALETLPSPLQKEPFTQYMEQLPVWKEYDQERFYHIFNLPDFGLLILLKKQPPLSNLWINALIPLNVKLAHAAIACEQNREISFMAQELNKKDIEQKTGENPLIQSHNVMDSILDSVNAFICVEDLQTYEIIFMNQYMKDMFGEDYTGRPCYEAFHHRDTPCIDCRNMELYDENGDPGKIIVYEKLYDVVGKWFLQSEGVIPWINGQLMHLEIGFDISRLKELEKKHIEIMKINENQRLEALGNLAGSIAHGFKDLIMNISGNISLMKMDLPHLHPDLKRYQAIEKQLNKTNELTNQLLGYAHKGQYVKKSIVINHLITNLVDNFSRMNDSVDITLDLGTGISQVYGDPHQLENVLWSVLENSVDAMPNGGTITISTANALCQCVQNGNGSFFHRSNGQTWHSFKTDPSEKHGEKDGINSPCTSSPPLKQYNHVKIVISDTGSGIEEKNLTQVFEPFFTTRSTEHRSGLGLATAHGITVAHGGTIKIDSRINQGTDVTICLPSKQTLIVEKTVAPPHHVDSPPPALGAQPAPVVQLHVTKNRDKIKTLVVDLDANERGESRDLLEVLNCHVLESSSAKDALTVFIQNKNRLDLVILDLNIPDMDIVLLFNKLITIRSDLTVLISGSQSMNTDIEVLIRNGAKGYMQKPLSLSNLKKIIRQM